MDCDEQCAAFSAFIAIVYKDREFMRKKLKRQHRQLRFVWVEPWLTQSDELGVDNTLLQEFRLEEGDEYQRFLIMFLRKF